MKNQVKIGAVLSYLGMGINIIIGLIYTPVMIRLLGQNEYGLYNTVASTISTLSVLKMGFNSSYVRYYAKYRKNEKKLSSLNGLFLLIFSVIGLIALFCGIYLTINLELVFSSGLTEKEYGTAKILMLLLTFKLAISFPMSVFSSIISAHERYLFQKLLGIIGTICNPLVTLPLLLMGYKSIGLVCVSVIIAFTTEIIDVYYVLKVLRNKFVFHSFEKGLFKSLFVYSSFIAINMIVDQINWNVDKILLGRYRGTEEVAIYSVGFSLYSYYQMFSTSISGIFTPRIHKIVVDIKCKKEQNKKLTELFVKVGRIQYLLLALIATGILIFGKEFITNIWADKGYSNSYYVALLLVFPATIALIQNIGIEIQRAENKHQFRSFIYAGMALLNLCLSIILCQKFGSIGSAIGTSISLIIANGLIMNIFYHKKCNINIIVFWKNIISLSKGIIIPLIFACVLRQVMNFNIIWQFGLGVCMYTCIYIISMWNIAMNKYEKELISNPLKKIMNKLKMRDGKR